MSIRGIIAVGVASALLAGCATTPDVTVSYYLPKSSPKVTVVRTVGCDKNGRLHVLSSVVSTNSISADPTQKHQVALRDLNGYWSNPDVGFTLADDGRLTGLNVAQAGQGTEIVEGAIKVASAFIPGGGLLTSDLNFESLMSDGGKKKSKPVPKPKSQAKLVCEAIQAAGDDGVSLTFTGAPDFSAPLGQPVVLAPTPESRADFEAFGKAVLGDTCLVTEKLETSAPILDTGPKDARRFIKLTLRQPAQGSAKVTIARMTVSPTDGRIIMTGCTERLWAGDFALPQLGQTFEAPVPKAVVFGKQSFGLGLSDAGAVTSVKYARDSGAAGAWGSVSTVGGALIRSPSERAAAVQAEADAIAQQQRLMHCKLDPATCPT